MKIGEKIKNIRLSQFLTQEEFAKLLNVTFCTVNRWENNKAVPNMTALKKIRDFCTDRSITYTIIAEDLEGK